MTTLLWKVGNTYHLCGEGGHESSYASLAGDYLKLFLPIVDILDGPRFVTGRGVLAGSMRPVSWAQSGDRESPGNRVTPAAADDEPPVN
jgi:hypothetical protein